jgi:hypothetical protein
MIPPTTVQGLGLVELLEGLPDLLGLDPCRRAGGRRGGGLPGREWGGALLGEQGWGYYIITVKLRHDYCVIPLE